MASVNVKRHPGGLTITPPPAPGTSEAADTLFSPGMLLRLLVLYD